MAASEEFIRWNKQCGDCINWLKQCGVVSKNKPVNEDEPYDAIIAKFLKDGKLLSKLAEFLNNDDPFEFPHQEQEGTSSDDPDTDNIEKIGRFMMKCVTKFDLSYSDLIDPQVWYDFSCPEKVLSILSKLSISQKARTNHPEIEGFLQKRDTYDSIISVNEKCNKRDNYVSTLSLKDVHQGSEDDLSLQSSTDIENSDYSDLVLYEIPHNEIEGQQPATVQNSCRMRLDEYKKQPSEPSLYEDLESIYGQIYQKLQINDKKPTSKTSKTQLEYVVEELLKEERINVSSLGDLIEKFLEPLKGLLKGCTNTIFPKIREIHHLHSELLLKVEQATNPLSIMKLCRAFKSFRYKFLVYAEYCYKLEEAMAKLNHLCESNHEIAEKIMICQENHNNIQLHNAISYPSLKFTKYPLIFENMAKACSVENGEKQEVTKITDMMRDINYYNDEAKSDYEDLTICRKVISNISNLKTTDCFHYGRLLLDGEFYQISQVDDKLHRRYGFVFEKFLIVTIPNAENTKFHFRSIKTLEKSQAIIEQSRKHSQNRDMRLRYPLNLMINSSSKNLDIFTLYLKNENCREQWLSAFEKAIEIINPIICRRFIHKFEIKTCVDPKLCSICSKFLGGLIHQGYHCKVCGILVHKKCIVMSSSCNIVKPEPKNYEFLLNYIWFVGIMKREMAEEQLRERACGTFLVRYRLQTLRKDETPFAISLKTQAGIKHLIIYKREVNDKVLYKLTSRRQFNLIADLISFYGKNDLRENFADKSEMPGSTFLLYPLSSTFQQTT